MNTSGPRGCWPIRPRPKPDEILSSWVTRIAHTYGLDASAFCTSTWGRKTVLKGDPDAAPPEDLISVLSQGTGIPVDRVKETTLDSIGTSTGGFGAVTARAPWLIPGSGSASVGIQWCPACLREDGDTPYWRKWWRVGFVAACSQHGLILSSRCHACGASARPQRVSSNVPKALASCFLCGAYLGSAPPRPSATAAWVQFQTRLQWVAHTGHVHIPNHGLVRSEAFFTVLRQVVRLLATGHAAEPLRLALRNIRPGPPLTPPKFPGPARDFCLLPPEERWPILLTASELMRQWPQNLVQAFTDAAVWKGTISSDIPWMPWMLDAAITWNLDRTSYQVSSEELAAAARYLKRHGKDASKETLKRFLSTDSQIRSGGVPFVPSKQGKRSGPYQTREARKGVPGRPPALDDAKFQLAAKLLSEGVQVRYVAEDAGVSIATLKRAFGPLGRERLVKGCIDY